LANRDRRVRERRGAQAVAGENDVLLRAPFSPALRVAILLALVLLAAWTTLALQSPDTAQSWSALAYRLLPLPIAIALAIAVVIQGRRAESNRKLWLERERRFRVAVEAARCGIWEWDLKADEVFMSEITGVMLGWGGGGTATGAEIIDRIAPEDRERVRAALDSASRYGAFDVSFGVTDASGRAAWIDARGQAIGQSLVGESGYRRIIGVALDVTDERAAQSRAKRPKAGSGTPSRTSATPSCCGTRAAACSPGTAPSATSSRSTPSCCAQGSAATPSRPAPWTRSPAAPRGRAA
jgi:PAS domain-containing protein